jgi:hypothetical protein
VSKERIEAVAPVPDSNVWKGMVIEE